LLWQTKRNNQAQPTLFTKSNIIITLVLTCIIAVLASSTEVQAMFGFFKRHTVEMSPEVRGRITDGGNPVVGIQVARSLSYEGYQGGKEQLEHTLTNENGDFSFPAITIKSRMPGDIFGQNMLVKQSVYVEKGDNLFSLWFTRKVWFPIEQMSNLLLKLDADLTNKEVQYEIDTTRFGGMSTQAVTSICHWKEEYMTTYYNNEFISSFEEIN